MSSVLNKDNENKKYRKKFSAFKVLFSPIIILLVLLFYQFYIILNFKKFMDDTGLDFCLQLLNIVFIFYLINARRVRSDYKIMWMVIFICMPGIGVLLYAFFKIVDIFNKGRKKLRDIVNLSKKYYKNSCNDNIREYVLENKDKFNYSPVDLVNENLINELSFFNFFDRHAHFPSYTNTDLKYFNNGKLAFEDILESLKNAKEFIFIEIFILSDGIVWREILKILTEKAKEGVKVRLMFDGINSLSSFNSSYCDILKKYNIEAKVFKPLAPVLAITQNQRDHRKLFIIDNKIAYTGGVNIADEYANLYERFGVWKDAAIRVEGNAVESFVIMFLQVWYMDEKTNIYDFESYLTKYDKKVKTANKTAIITPYTDYPGLSENISLQIYKYMINCANKYIYIMTPYLVIDEEMSDALESAAKRGVDVRIIVPHIQDKKYVFFVNRSYYKNLTFAGVKVYEYLPGFIHSKCYLQDDIRAVVGTANLDFRSMYLHYENGVYYFADNDAIMDLKADFDKTFGECKEMTLYEIDKIHMIHRVLGKILRIFAPLM